MVACRDTFEWNTVHRHKARTALDTQTLWKWHQLAPEQTLSLPRSMHCNPDKWQLQGIAAGTQAVLSWRKTGRSSQVSSDFQTHGGETWLLPSAWHCWDTSAMLYLVWGSPVWDTMYWSKISPRYVEVGAYVYKRRLREMGLFSLEEKILEYVSLLPEAARWEGEDKTAFSELLCGGIKCNRHALECGKFQLNISKNIFSIRVVKYWSWKCCRILASGNI